VIYLEYVKVDPNVEKGVQAIPETMTVKKDAEVSAPAPAQPAIPRIPVYLDDSEKIVDFRKPGFWAYTPTLYLFFLGLAIVILFTLGGGLFGLMIGLVIMVVMMYFVRERLWARSGYWFTDHKIVIRDGSKVMLVPYEEIALSSLAFEGENCMFSTIYNKEIVLKGIVDMDQVVAFISNRVKVHRKENGKS
jgi:hypothetical protein